MRNALSFYRSDRAYFLAAARRLRAAGDIEAARTQADEMTHLRVRFSDVIEAAATGSLLGCARGANAPFAETDPSPVDRRPSLASVLAAMRPGHGFSGAAIVDAEARMEGVSWAMFRSDAGVTAHDALAEEIDVLEIGAEITAETATVLRFVFDVAA